MTVHQYEEKDSLKEIYRVSGGDMGGLKVDRLFENLLKKLFSKANIEQIKNEAYAEWMKIHGDFEKGKKMIIEGATDNTISIGTSKLCPWNRDHFTSLSKDVTKGVELKKNGRLVISKSIIKDMIQKVAVSITNHIGNIFKDIDTKSLNAIVMVGGFSNSPVVRLEIMKLVNYEVPTIVPGDAELCVVKGAVLFGWKSNVIRVRKSRMTYGICWDDIFIEGVHDNSKSYIDEYGKWCQDCFRKLVTVSQDIEVNQQIESSTHHSYAEDITSTIPLLATANENPKYKDDKGVKVIGEIRIPKTKESWGKKIIINFYFGETELKVKVFDETTGETYEKEIDFMFDNCVKFEE